MSTATTIVEAPEPAHVSTFAGMLQGVIADRDPKDITPELLKGYMDIYERALAAEAADEFGRSLALFQEKCPQIKKTRQLKLGKDGSGPMYASLDDIMREIRALLAECGLSVTFSATLTPDGKMRAVCNVRKGRHSEASEITLAVPSQMSVNDTQKMGAALSYAKRYALCAALNIIVTDEDDDAAKMSVTIDDKQAATIQEWMDTIPDFKPKPFFRWLEIESLSELPAANYDMVINELKRKAQEKGVKVGT